MSTPEEALRAGIGRLVDFHKALRDLSAKLAEERAREEEQRGLTVPAGTPELEQKGGG